MDKRQIRVVPTEDSGWELKVRDDAGEEYTIVTFHNIPNVPGFSLPDRDALLELAGLVSAEIMRTNPTVECTIV